MVWSGCRRGWCERLWRKIVILVVAVVVSDRRVPTNRGRRVR